MAAPDIATVKARIEAIAATVPGITTVITSGTTELPAAALPAIEVRVADAERSQTNRDHMQVARVYELWLFVASIPADESNVQMAHLLDALQDCFPFVDSVPDTFRLTPRLELNNQALNGVLSTGLMSDTGPRQTPWWNGKEFSCVRFRLTVTTRR